MSEPTEDSQLEYTYFSKIQIKIDGVSDEAGFWDACKALAQARRDRIDIDSYTGALQFLADANRHERWREPCGKHAILTEALLGLQAFKQETKVAEQALRLIGNCCIDNDSNREAVAPHLWSILEVLTEAEVGLRVTAFSALYNVVLDSDNAAFEAAKLRVHDTLIEMLCAGKFGGQARSLEVLNMVRSIVSTAAESALPVLDSVSTCNALLSLGACDAQLSIDRSLYQTKSSYADLLCTLIMYLESDVFKEHSFDSKQLVDLLYVQRRGYSHANTMATEEHDYEDEDDEEDSASVREACQTLNRTLIRFSGIDEFGTIALESHDRLTSDLTNLSVNARDVLLEHLRIATTLEEHDIVAQKPFLDACNTWNSDDLMAFQSCTCVLLGNIAVSDDICIDMAQRTSAFESTLHLLQSPATSREVRHAAAGLLRHLARPDDNKELFLKRHVVNACESLILEDDLQMLEAGLALIRQIAQHMPTRQIERSDFVILKTITERCARLDVESSIAAVAVAECARLVVTMARSILRIGSEAEPNDIKWFLETPRLLHCVVEAVRYSEVLFVRSECWFGLALMASRAESAGALSRVLAEDQLIEALERLATAAATPSDEAGGRSNEGAKDRENALFLIHKTLDLEGMDIEERKKTILVELEKTFVKG